MRLIDADQFITEMEINIGNIYNPDIIKGMRFGIELIKNMPAAFDKEKVINDLLKASICSSPDEDSFVELIEAIEIVEKGGVD